MSIDSQTLTKGQLPHVAALHQKAKDAHAAVARSATVGLFLWQARPQFATLGEMYSTAETDEQVRNALADEEQALSALGDVEDEMVALGWLTDDERTVVTTDDA